MDTNHSTNTTTDTESPIKSQAPAVEPEADDFQITVKKLELPVKPRGVLAE